MRAKAGAGAGGPAVDGKRAEADGELAWREGTAPRGGGGSCGSGEAAGAPRASERAIERRCESVYVIRIVFFSKIQGQESIASTIGHEKQILKM